MVDGFVVAVHSRCISQWKNEAVLVNRNGNDVECFRNVLIFMRDGRAVKHRETINYLGEDASVPRLRRLHLFG